MTGRTIVRKRGERNSTKIYAGEECRNVKRKEWWDTGKSFGSREGGWKRRAKTRGLSTVRLAKDGEGVTQGKQRAKGGRIPITTPWWTRKQQDGRGNAVSVSKAARSSAGGKGWENEG